MEADSNKENKPNWNSGQAPTETCGDYLSETDSGKIFDEVVERSGLFKIWGYGKPKGITGEMIQPLPGMDNHGHYFLDRILKPTPKLREAGWTKGLIGVELKKVISK